MAQKNRGALSETPRDSFFLPPYVRQFTLLTAPLNRCATTYVDHLVECVGI